MKGKKSPIPAVHKREREEGKMRVKLPPMIYEVPRVGFSSGREQRFIASTRGTRGYLKRGISPKIQGGDFGKMKLSG